MTQLEQQYLNEKGFDTRGIDYEVVFVFSSSAGPRRSGRTTRTVNDVVEALLQGKSVYVVDHHELTYGKNLNSFFNLKDRICKRLKYEFGIPSDHHSTRLEINDRVFKLVNQ